MGRQKRLVLLLCAFAACPAAAQPARLGVYGVWGAFSDGGRCWAIARPGAAGSPGGRAFASVGYWRSGPRGQFHARLSGDKRAESAVLARIDGRTFSLIGSGADAWAPDPTADAALLTAMRTGVTLVVETRSVSGGLIADQYRLQGAPSAIDAAALGCLAR